MTRHSERTWSHEGKLEYWQVCDHKRVHIVPHNENHPYLCASSLPGFEQVLAKMTRDVRGKTPGRIKELLCPTDMDEYEWLKKETEGGG